MSQGLSKVTGVLFSVQQNGTVALCDLAFSTDLTEIQSASVTVLMTRVTWLISICSGVLSDSL